MSRSKSVVIVEDSKPTRDRLSSIVENNPSLRLIDAVDCVRLGQACLEANTPDVLLTDLDLPDGNGIELIRYASRNSCTESIVITVLGDEKSVVGAIQAGASGYILKDSEPADIGDTILQTCNGASTISPSVARYLLKQFSSTVTAAEPEILIQAKPPLVSPASTTDQENKTKKLTNREYEVLRLIAKGFTYQETASALSVSIHTITTHLKHIYRKLAVSSRGEAVYEATQSGLI